MRLAAPAGKGTANSMSRIAATAMRVRRMPMLDTARGRETTLFKNLTARLVLVDAVGRCTNRADATCTTGTTRSITRPHWREFRAGVFDLAQAGID